MSKIVPCREPGDGFVCPPDPVPSFGNTADPSEWEFCWEMNNLGPNDVAVFLFRQHGDDHLSIPDYDLSPCGCPTLRVSYEETSYEYFVWLTEASNRDAVREMLLAKGFTENPEILNMVDDVTHYTPEMIQEYHEVLRGKDFRTIQGLGWDAMVSFDPDDPPEGAEEVIIEVEPQEGENDQGYEFSLPGSWDPSMECQFRVHDASPVEVRDTLLGMGFTLKHLEDWDD